MTIAARCCWCLLAALICHGCAEPGAVKKSPVERLSGVWEYDAVPAHERVFQKSVRNLRHRLGGEEHPDWSRELEAERKVRDANAKYRMFRLELKTDSTWEMENGGAYGGIVRGAIPTRATGRWSITDDVVVLSIDTSEGQRKDRYPPRDYHPTMRIGIVGHELHVHNINGGYQLLGSDERVETVRLTRRD